MRHRFSVADTADMVALSYFVPPVDLAHYFGAMYLFTADQPRVADHTRADFAQIRFMLAGSGAYRFVDGHRAETPECCLLGATSAATHFDVHGPLQVFGVSVLPLGWAALRAGDADATSDDVVDLAARFGPGWTDMLSALRRIDDPGSAEDIFWAFIRDHLHPVPDAERRFIEVVDRWLADEQSPRVEVLQETTGLSARQLARWCNRLYGAPPKYLARKYRALRCAQVLAREDLEWAEVSGDAFYDQSHFIREIKHFTGLTPTELRERASIVIRLSMKRAELKDGIAKLSQIS
ncbi:MULTISPECIES: AraC family transcriptional regulator [unclassified Sphingobium]|uniref:AraC family transcriptional regulator n=1 Tax=unclassified Sphingobium TaxID=2611147 RepID=UPI00222402DF|nr:MULTISPECIES: helix-turn-helix domain-containing protein [unclassified Sphingobium]MCW2396482.1 AraC-like DNA-binding protein [Sphingobium sp. B8D3B]MCW2419998.1 AraC-like DNA-binding protein [Sphingobium sp. B8D3C]